MALQAATTILKMWVLVSFGLIQQVASDIPSQLSESFGGPHGNPFSDQAAVVGGETVSSITIRAGARIDGITLGISAPNAQAFTHGYDGVSDTMNTLQLKPGEYNKSMKAHWKNRHTDDHTRVFYLNFVTSEGNSVSGGTQTDYTGSFTAPEGYQLAGFFGRDGGEIDMLGAVWAPLSAVDVGPATVTPADFSVSRDTDTETPVDVSASASHDLAAPDDSSASLGSGSAASDDTIEFPSSGSIDSGDLKASDGSLMTSEQPTTTAPAPSGPATQLSETFGGPHGTEFSDQPLATSGQTVSSIAIRAGARIDGITLTVTAPTAQTFIHGFDGVSDTNNALSLNAGEYIKSMEVHWDKNSHTNDQTRVFYLNFVTSTGRFVSAGSQTDTSSTATDTN